MEESKKRRSFREDSRTIPREVAAGDASRGSRERRVEASRRTEARKRRGSVVNGWRNQ